MEDTTTDAATQDTGVTTDVTQPEEQPAEAVTTANSEPTTDPGTEPVDEADNSEDDLNQWAVKKGIDLSTPEGQAKALKSMREAEKAMHAKAQKASELEKAMQEAPLDVDTDNELLRQIAQDNAALKTSLTIQQWKDAKGITPEQDDALGQYVTENPNVGYLYKNGHITLDQLYAMSGVGNPDPSAIKKAGEQEALQKLANKQRATSVKGAATTNDVTVSEDPILAALRD